MPSSQQHEFPLLDTFSAPNIINETPPTHSIPFNDQNHSDEETSWNLGYSEKTFYKIKLVLTVATVVICSFQVYNITVNRLQHSRNFIRYLHYYLLEHENFDIYWSSDKDGNNYPIHEYFQVSGVQHFLERLQDTFLNMQDSVYGSFDIEKFTSDRHKVYLQDKTGQIEQHDYVIADGFTQPFQVKNLFSIKDAILRSQQINIYYQPFRISNHDWHLIVSITDYSDCSIFVQIHAEQSMMLIDQHVTTFVLGCLLLIVLIWEYLANPRSLATNLPDYLLCGLLLNTFLFSLAGPGHVNELVVVDGVQCLASWLLILKFVTKEDDYHISFLLKKSYLLVGRLFVSFAPIFVAFTMFAYIMFCREAWQFSSFRRAFLNLFYISYYNMTYESFVVTSRTNPISMVFFFLFVILFTICVYSGMLVSVFCSYVWNKRESKIKDDIINNLKIQCSQCDHKYKYVDCLQMATQHPADSLRMSLLLHIDFTNSEERYKYKQALQSRINHLASELFKALEDSRKELHSVPLIKQQLQKSLTNARGVIKEQLNNIRKEDTSRHSEIKGMQEVSKKGGQARKKQQ